ncbi:hypothetical protein LCGC14_1058260 [marine sediment metagenome]|uniref:Uncharacterized protein n=1 Tax=marine sediment metagenome TaxID=412755 RepID=A0A0F9MM13_9ZZZZ
MKVLRKILELTEREKDPENDPYDARAALDQDLRNLKDRVDLYFGSAGDVADGGARRKMVTAINEIRARVMQFGEELEELDRRAEKKIDAALRKFT